jgi:two-component system chemotaxis sensor kinase CheA
MPDNPRLGELLVLVGAITPRQLRQGLRSQSEAAAETGQAAPLGEILQANTGLSPQVVAAALNKQSKQREGRASAPAAAEDSRYIRVHADKLDAVINLLGELVIASAGAGLLARQTRQGRLIEANQQIGSLVEEIRNGTLQLRMVPIGETFSRFRRVVRDTASELGKDVQFEIQGGDTELDKSVVERIADPLMHLVRNALDHGLETPEQRIAAGKPAQGTLTISACHEAGSILIGIQDDGRGIDRERVLQRAWERGLVEQGVTPPDADILKLIFEPGFSTAEKVTNLSGRGVGMDVVRRNIEALRGSVTLSSEPGQGSHIALRLPLTLAIIDGFLVGVGPSKFIFPLDAVVEVIEARSSTGAVDDWGRSVIELRGQVLPVVSLRALYALDSAEPVRSSVVVIRAGGVRFGVRVDQLLGQHQTVIKPLGRMFRSLRGMSGSSILGNGEVALIFDVASLGQLASTKTDGRARRAQRTDTRNANSEPHG